MTTGHEPTLEEQSRSLREQLERQRQTIAQQLAPAPRGAHPREPRSITMRLLTRQTGLVLKLLALLVGARWAGKVTSIATVAGVVLSTFRGRTPHPQAALQFKP